MANRQETAQAATNTFASAADGAGKKERLTIDWFAKVVHEFRTEVAELQEAQSNTTRMLQQRNRCGEELFELRDDFSKLNLELSAIRLHQNTLDQSIKELQAEAIQRDDDFRRSQLQVSVLFYFSFFFLVVRFGFSDDSVRFTSISCVSLYVYSCRLLVNFVLMPH